jgi:hypothetical protein
METSCMLAALCCAFVGSFFVIAGAPLFMSAYMLALVAVFFIGAAVFRAAGE